MDKRTSRGLIRFWITFVLVLFAACSGPGAPAATPPQAAPATSTPTTAAPTGGEMAPGVEITIRADKEKPAAGDLVTLTIHLAAREDLEESTLVVELPEGAALEGDPLAGKVSLKNGETQEQALKLRLKRWPLEKPVRVTLSNPVTSYTAEWPRKDTRARQPAVAEAAAGTFRDVEVSPAVEVALAASPQQPAAGQVVRLTARMAPVEDGPGSAVFELPPGARPVPGSALAWQGDLVAGQPQEVETEFVMGDVVEGAARFVLTFAGSQTFTAQVVYSEPPAAQPDPDVQMGFPVPPEASPEPFRTPGSEAGPVQGDPALLASITVNGYFRYAENNDTAQYRGAFPAVVEVFELDDFTYNFVCGTLTTATGSWSCSGSTSDGDGQLELFARIYAYHYSYYALISNPSHSPYGSQTATFLVPEVSGTVNMNVWRVNCGGAYPCDGAFHLLRMLYYGNELVYREGSERVPGITVHWPIPGGGTTSYYNAGEIFIAGPGVADPDEWDETVVLHEYGHYVMDSLSEMDPPNVDYCHDPGETYPNCGHSFNSHEDQPTAYIEGWANFFQSAVKHYWGLANPDLYEETTWSANLETSWHAPGSGGPWDNVESAPSGILLDIMDTEDDDQNSDGFGDLMDDEYFRVHIIFSRTDIPGPHYSPWNIHEFYDGYYAVYITNRSAQIRNFYEHGINKDTYPPANASFSIASIEPTNSSAWTHSRNARLNIAATDQGLGMRYMRMMNTGGAWTSWQTYASTYNWTLPAGDGTKTVLIQYADFSQNTSPSYSASIGLDTAAPTGTLTIDGGAQYTLDPEVQLAITCDDSGSGPYRVQVTNTTSNWGSLLTCASPRSHTLTAGEGLKTVALRVHDLAGNVSPTVTRSIFLDTSVPTGGIAIAGGAAYTITPAVTLNLTASDGAAGAGIAAMRFSTNGADWTGWEAYAATRAYTLDSAEGAKTVYAQYRDRAGRVSTAYSDTITLDTQPPTGSIQINSNAFATNNAAVTLNLTTADTGTGPHQMRFSTDGVNWNAWVAASSSLPWTLLPGDGTKTVYVQFNDHAGWTSQTYSDSIVYDTSKPVAQVSAPLVTLETSFTVTVTVSDGPSGPGDFALYYRASPAGAWTLYEQGSGSGGSFTFGPDLPGGGAVTPGTVYYFLAQAQDRAGNACAVPGAGYHAKTMVASMIMYIPMLAR